jgi:hypothetical protein
MPARKRRRSFQDYRPIRNQNGDTRWFETYGEELEEVKAQVTKDPRKVWTIVDCEGKLYVVAGCHFVNRLNYIITELPWESDDIQYRY